MEFPHSKCLQVMVVSGANKTVSFIQEPHCTPYSPSDPHCPLSESDPASSREQIPETIPSLLRIFKVVNYLHALGHPVPRDHHPPSCEPSGIFQTFLATVSLTQMPRDVLKSLPPLCVLCISLVAACSTLAQCQRPVCMCKYSSYSCICPRSPLLLWFPKLPHRYSYTSTPVLSKAMNPAYATCSALLYTSISAVHHLSTRSMHTQLQITDDTTYNVLTILVDETRENTVWLTATECVHKLQELHSFAAAVFVLNLWNSNACHAEIELEIIFKVEGFGPSW